MDSLPLWTLGRGLCGIVRVLRWAAGRESVLGGPRVLGMDSFWMFLRKGLFLESLRLLGS